MSQPNEWNGDNLIAGIRSWSAEAKAAAGDALFLLAEEWGQRGNRTVPIEEAVLQNSMTTAADKPALKAAVGWGRGAARAYAVRQHEDTSLKHDPGRGPMWGSNAGRDIARIAPGFIADEVRSKAGG